MSAAWFCLWMYAHRCYFMFEEPRSAEWLKRDNRVAWRPARKAPAATRCEYNVSIAERCTPIGLCRKVFVTVGERCSFLDALCHEWAVSVIDASKKKGWNVSAVISHLFCSRAFNYCELTKWLLYVFTDTGSIPPVLAAICKYMALHAENHARFSSSSREIICPQMIGRRLSLESILAHELLYKYEP